jgi:hypothetical protein
MPAFMALADDTHALDQRVVQNALGTPVALEQYVCRLFDFVLEAIVEIVVDLLGELLVVQARQVKFVYRRFRHAASPAKFPEAGQPLSCKLGCIP